MSCFFDSQCTKSKYILLKNIRRLSRISFKYLQHKTQNIYALQISVKTVLFFYNIVSQSMISLKF